MTDRNKLVEDNLGLVGVLVRRFAEAYPYVKFHELDDYSQVGRMALMKCAKRWEPVKNVKFTSYAYHRIYGSMKDEYRRLHCWRHTDGSTSPKPRPMSIDAANKVHQQNSIIDNIKCPYDTPEQSAITKDVLKTLINLLPSKRRKRDEFVIRQLMDGKTLKEVGAAIGVTESRLCQIRQEIAGHYKFMNRGAA